LTASYILDASGISAGVDEADGQLDRLGTSADALGDDFDKSTSRIGGALEAAGVTL
jgi:hypothetical protein